MRKRRRLPAPPPTPPGMMWVLVLGQDRLVPIAEVERAFRGMMAGWDVTTRADKRAMLEPMSLPGDHPHLVI